MAKATKGTKEYAIEMRDLWLDAQEALATGKSYKIGTRQLTRADTSEIQEWIGYWEDKITKFENGRRKKQKMVLGVPRDL